MKTERRVEWVGGSEGRERKGPQMGHAHPIHSFKAAAKSAEIVIVMNSRRPCRRWIYEAKTIGARAQIEVRPQADGYIEREAWQTRELVSEQREGELQGQRK